MTDTEARLELRRRGICEHCQMSVFACEAGAPQDYGAHERYWTANHESASRPWWSASELLRIIG